MSTCKIKYIEKQPFSETEKERLSTIHKDIFDKAKESKSFRSYEGKLYTLKNEYGKATEFVADINKEYPVSVAKIQRSSPSQHFLSVNVLPLSRENQQTLYFNNQKDEIRNIIQGGFQDENGKLIQSIKNNIRTSKTSGSGIEQEREFQGQEIEKLKKYIDNNDLWYNQELKEENLIDVGNGEQFVYFDEDNQNMIKLNDKAFYTYWEDYFNNLLLNNYFFPETAYNLVGFKNQDDKIYAVVKQKFIEKTQDTNLKNVEDHLRFNGFIKPNPLKNDYVNKNLGIILEDVHDENVIVKDDQLYFIDTTFYFKNLETYKQTDTSDFNINKAPESVIKISKELLQKIGVNYEQVKNIYVNGVKIGANGIANITQRLVQVVQGKEAEALPEETMHFIVEILEQTNPKLFNKLLNEINNYNVYKEVLTDYSNDPFYQTKEGKPDIRKLKKEAIAKQLVNTIISKVEGNENPELIAKVQNWWNDILDFIKNLFVKSGFDYTTLQILAGEVPGTVEDIKDDRNDIFLQKEAERYTAEEIAESFKSKDKPNERKFNRPTNLSKGFSVLQRTGVNQYTPLLSRESSTGNLGEMLDTKGGEKSPDGVSYFRGVMGRSFNSLFSKDQGGASLEGEKRRYGNLRVLQSLLQNSTNRRMAELLGVQEVRIINNDKGVPNNPLFVYNDILYINEDSLKSSLEHLYSKDVNLDEYLDMSVFEELIHIATTKLHSKNEIVDAGNELGTTDKSFVDNFYSDGARDISLSSYQTIGELIRMKVQKDLAKKSTEDVANQSILDNIVSKIWDFLIDLFKNKLIKSNKIAENVKNFILNKEEFDINNSGSDEILGAAPVNTQDSLYNNLQQIASGVEKRGEEGYYVNGKKVLKRVSDLIHDWYSRRFAEKALTATDYEKAVNTMKAEKGTAGHKDIEHAFSLFVDENGYLREEPLVDEGYVSLMNPNDQSIYNILKDNLRNRLNSFPKGTRFLKEITVYDQKRNLAGTIDFLAITPTGKVSVLDWKFIDLNINTYKDVPWFKVTAWNKQMEQYKGILERVYGVKSQDFEQTRMIPIKAVYSKPDTKSGNLPVLQSIQIGDVNVKNIKDDYLLPVGQGEKTGNKRIDSLIEKLNAVYDKLSSKKVLPDEKIGKADQLNALYTAIRQLQIKNNLRPLLYQAQLLNKQIKELLEKYNTKWKDSDPLSFSQEEISDFALELEDAQNSISNYINLDQELKFLFPEEMTEQEKELKQQLRDTVDTARDIQSDIQDTINEFADNIISKSEGVEGSLLSPEKIIKGIAKWFNSTSSLQSKAIEILFKKANRAFLFTAIDTLDENKKLKTLQKNYIKWAKSKGIAANNFDILKKKKKNELIDEFKSEFYTELKNKIAQTDTEWIKNNIDIDKYKEYIKDKLAKEIQRIKDKPRVGDPESIDMLIDFEIAKIEKLHSLENNKSLGWQLYKDISKFPKDKWQTDDWKELIKPENKAAKDFYDYIKERNKFFHSIGYLHSGVRTFLPYVRKGLMEKIVTSGVKEIKLGEQFLRDISIDDGDVGYGQKDPFTGEIIDKIPIYFTKEIEGALSEDLFRNMALINETAIKYKQLTDIEGQLRLILNVERNKKAISTSYFGKTEYKDGNIVYTPDNKENSKLYQDMLKSIIYGQKYIQSETFDQLLGTLGNFGEKANKKLGINIFPENLEGRQVSINKVLTQLNNVFQLNALGLNPLSALSNFLGGSFQSTINSGKYFTKSDFIKTELWLSASKMTGRDQKKYIAALEYFLPLTDNYNKEIAKTLTVNKLSQENIQEFLMILMRKSDWFVQTTNFYAYLDNSVVIDGKVENAREYLRKQPEYQDMFKGTSEERKTRREKFEKDVNDLIKEKGIVNIAKVEDGKLVIPGVERKSQSVVELRRKVQQLSKDALGNLSEDDVRLINLNIYGKSFMVFKNWIPRPIDVRMGNLKYNNASDAYEWGRMRMVFRLLSTDLIKSINSLKSAITGDSDQWISQMRNLYETKKEEYEKETGKTLNMSEGEFLDLVSRNIKSQLIDTIFMLSLISLYLGMVALAPDDDEDDKTKSVYKYALRATDKIKDELWFFYDPTSLLAMASGGGIFPSLSYLTNLKKLIYNFGKEMYGIAFDDELAEDTYVIKYLLKSFPLVSQSSAVLPMFYPELAKDLDLRIGTQSRMGR